MGRYRGTAWDWTVIPFLVGLFLLGNGLTHSNVVTALIGVVIAGWSGWKWYARRNSVDAGR